MRTAAILLIPAALASLGAAAAIRSATSSKLNPAAPSAPPTMARNIDKALDSPLSVTFQNDPIAKVFAGLQAKTNTNLIINWPAFNHAGITRDTRLTLKLTAASYEEILRCILFSLPFKDTTGNYEVGDNTVELTTNADIAKAADPQIYSIDRAVTFSANGRADAGEQTQHAQLVEKVLRAELLRQGETLDPANAPIKNRTGHQIAVRKLSLAADVSDRGHDIIEKVLQLFAQPSKVTMLPKALIQTVAARKAADIFRKSVHSPAELLDLARHLDKVPGLNVMLMPAAREALARQAATPPDFDSFITPGGTVVIGTWDEVSPHHPLVIYDLRDIIKRTIARATRKPAPNPRQVQDDLVKSLKEKVPAPDRQKWGDIGTPAVMVPSDGILIVVAPFATHQQITQALAQAYR
ncbi:MAG TPA: hypothetical protein VHQ47_08530 [Phycisphaerae bacterium]|nr:hypothetical protein [Phycisphaerae bacterium]